MMYRMLIQPPESRLTRCLCPLSLGRNVAGLQLVLSDRKAARDDAPALALVDDVDGVVLAVATRDPEEHARPPPEAEPAFAREGPREDKRVAFHPKVTAELLRHSVDVHLERSRDIGRKVNS
jgi:hypothetical protein